MFKIFCFFLKFTKLRSKSLLLAFCPPCWWIYPFLYCKRRAKKVCPPYLFSFLFLALLYTSFFSLSPTYLNYKTIISWSFCAMLVCVICYLKSFSRISMRSYRYWLDIFFILILLYTPIGVLNPYWLDLNHLPTGGDSASHVFYAS